MQCFKNIPIHMPAETGCTFTVLAFASLWCKAPGQASLGPMNKRPSHKAVTLRLPRHEFFNRTTYGSVPMAALLQVNFYMKMPLSITKQRELTWIPTFILAS